MARITSCARASGVSACSTRWAGFRYLVARVEFLNDTGVTHPEVEARTLYPEAEGRRGDLAAAAGARPSSANCDAGDRVAVDARRHDRELPRRQAGREAGASSRRPSSATGSRRSPTFLTRRVEVLKLSRQIENQTKEAIDDRQREILLREQMQPDPEGARRRGPGRGRGRGARRGDHEGGHAARRRGACAQGAQASRAHERGERRVLDGAHVPRHADRAAVVEARRRVDRHRALARRSSTRTTTGSTKIKRRILEYLAVRKLNPRGTQPDPVLRRPSGRRQDLARPVASRVRWGSSSSA